MKETEVSTVMVVISNIELLNIEVTFALYQLKASGL